MLKTTFISTNPPKPNVVKMHKTIGMGWHLIWSRTEFVLINVNIDALQYTYIIVEKVK